MTVATPSVGAPIERVDGRLKVTGQAQYAYESPVERPAYAWLVQSTIPKGRILAIDTAAALREPEVLAVLTHENAPRLHTEDAELQVLQSDRIAYHGQVIALVVAESSEQARAAAELVTIQYATEDHRTQLRADDDQLYAPEQVNPSFATDTEEGDVEGALAGAAVIVDRTYTTPAEHNSPIETHTTVACPTDGGGFELHDTNQGPHGILPDLLEAFDLDEDQLRILSPYVGGAFGSKAFTHPHQILALMAARATRRAVKLTLTRQQMFTLAGYRTPTIQRVALGAQADGRLLAIVHEVVEQTSAIKEFAEQTAVVTRMMYAAPHRRTSHRLAALDMPVPSIMRAPGECPGMFALESAIDELAVATGIDPIELRIRNEPERDPETGLAFSSRNLVACLREGAERFDWVQRDATPAVRREGRWLLGTGVASSTYPSRRRDSTALIRVHDDDYDVLLDASDIGTGAWTVLTQIAADALDAPVARIHLRIGDSALPKAPGAGGSMGTASWGSAIVDAASKLRADGGREALGQTGSNGAGETHAMHGYGAQFAQARVNVDSGEIRIPRLLGVFAVGALLNPRTARSQLVGGMTMGLSMALHEESVLDPRYGAYVTHDLAEYHIATNADIGEIEVSWIDEHDPHVNPMGAKGIGEIGIVGTAAAIANAVHHATGVRVRDLPLRPERVLAGL